MEIEDLKDIWKKQSEAFTPKDTSELANMLKGRSTSIIAKLKRNVWFELVFTYVVGIALLVYGVTLRSGWLSSVSISLVLLFCLYSFYYVKKLKLLNRFDANENLRENLRRLIKSLKGYLRFYKRSYAILYPLYFFLGLFFKAVEYGAEGFIEHISRPQMIAVLVVFATVFFACSMWLTNWYLKKLYGNHLEKLESILGELDA
jgi:Ca2+/Na+ antiporter